MVAGHQDQADPLGCCFRSLWLHLCLVVLVFSQLVVSFSTVRFLPGYPGPLPFELETGYVGVDESEDVQLFYYFVKSEMNPKEDPILLWLTGGPGCSVLSGLAYEIGPINFEIVEYNGSLPTLAPNSNSWTKVSNIIFVDLPVETGFSYTTSLRGSQTGDIKSSQHAYQFLRKWLTNHPEFLSNPVYIAGDSYSGITVPIIVQHIANANEAGIKPLINLKGYLLGNPITDQSSEGNSKIPYAHGMALISDELYEHNERNLTEMCFLQSAKRNCGGEYVTIDPKNAVCLEDVQAFDKCISGINSAHILEPKCPLVAPKPKEMVGNRRSLGRNFREFLDPQPPFPTFGCRTYAYLLSYYWVNDESVRKALNIRKGTVEDWQRCNNDLSYRYEIQSSFAFHVNLSKRGYRSLIYSGDHDMKVPFLATQAWIRSLNYSIVNDWRPWLVNVQIAGYTRSYSNHMTFATVKAREFGGGHTAPEYKPKECFAMFKRWISEEPL
ncbi:hypothetical protein HHK36_032415 [Tetracentron sinense]|uniref:Uncharacterized protein n=1 Tax=Tetracentron sinense TaxID=13715 RepID=A0A834Y7A9_TETSI|nr:hypothetical protein HHK36_032415 [Tetracentron sinense]